MKSEFSLEENTSYQNLQVELIALQRHIQTTKGRLVIIFEGRDTAGKGGAIMRFVRFLNPRFYRIVALNKPTEAERSQWYFQRYINQLPNPGEIVFFDRSWYNRAVVEPVMGFCSSEQYSTFMNNVVPLEKMWVEDGVTIVKFWFSINVEEQKKRLQERKDDPLKRWKLSDVDAKAQQVWDKYSTYRQEMFSKTSWDGAPWVRLDGNNKELARMEAMRYVLSRMDYPEKGETGERLTPNESILTIV